ncbi:MAG TPA: TIGR03560 family F420-dependent LLM class oxidoreductase [Solirubrobacteraceae bacterium]|nr:TIGR03560 family F420-dependent LLM class oxidoreductase [Solirubrobacteraceae bacterium]
MELCLMIEGQEGVTWPQWLALARACEAHGVGALFRSDHYANLDGLHPERGALDAWATLAALAASTTTLRLGTMVSPVTFRHPSQLARVVVTVDHVSGGRVELGLGAGWHEAEHRAHGFPFPEPSVRMDMLKEQLQVIVGSWTQAPFSFVGDHYTLRDLDAQPRPVQRPHPPLIVGGEGGPRSLALAAAYADEYNTAFATPERARSLKAALAAACERVGREQLPLSVMTGMLVGEDEAELRRRAVALERLAGIPDPVRNPPSGWIVGTSERACEQLAALRDAGVARVMCQHLLHEDLDAVALIGERLAPAVS